jgi:hypothetical protein
MIKPTVGRVVWFWPKMQARTEQPLAAIVASVHSDTMVNLGVFDGYSIPVSHTSVFLFQGEGLRPESAFCEWMPYQIGQAAKNAEAVK